jgi:hypothetical protein
MNPGWYTNNPKFCNNVFAGHTMPEALAGIPALIDIIPAFTIVASSRKVRGAPVSILNLPLI